MAMIPKLELRQTQGLVMTPQLQQAIKLLQMSNFELQSFVEAELERNPLLERDEATEQPPAAGVEGNKNIEIEAAGPGQYNQPDSGVAEGETADNEGKRLVEGQSDSGWSSLGQAGGGSFNVSDGFDFDNAL